MKLLWPVWLPYPSSILRTVILCFLLSPLGLSLRIFGNLAGALRYPGPAILLIVIGLLIPFVVYSYIHHFFCGNRPEGWPKSLPSPLSIWEGLYNLTVLLIASLVVLVFAGVIHNFEADYILKEQEEEATILGLIWIVVTLGLFQAEFFLRRGMAEEEKLGAKIRFIPWGGSSGNKTKSVEPFPEIKSTAIQAKPENPPKQLTTKYVVVAQSQLNPDKQVRSKPSSREKAEEFIKLSRLKNPRITYWIETVNSTENNTD